MALGLLLVVVALVALSLAPLAAAPTFTHLVMLPQTEKGLSSFLDIPFHTINRGMAASRMGFLDVTSSDDVRNWIYQQMVAMNVVVGAKNGIDMVYVGFEDGRFIGYFSIEGVKQYTFRPAGDAPPSDLSWAPHANAAAVNGAATCTGTQTSDSADCALATAWTSGDQSEGTCATADGCSFWAVQGVSGSDVSESCPTPTCTSTQTSDGVDCALRSGYCAQTSSQSWSQSRSRNWSQSRWCPQSDHPWLRATEVQHWCRLRRLTRAQWIEGVDAPPTDLPTALNNTQCLAPLYLAYHFPQNHQQPSPPAPPTLTQTIHQNFGR